MNNILQLKSQFYQRKNPNKPGSANLPVGKTVKGEHIVELTKQLKDILNYWKKIQKLKVLWLVSITIRLWQKAIE